MHSIFVTYLEGVVGISFGARTGPENMVLGGPNMGKEKKKNWWAKWKYALNLQTM